MSNLIQQSIGKLVTDDQVAYIKRSLNVIGTTCATISFLAFGVMTASIIFLIMYSSSSSPMDLFGSSVTLGNSVLMTTFFITITYIVFQIQPILFGKVGILRNDAANSETFDAIKSIGKKYIQNKAGLF